MGKVFIEESSLTAIADAIRAKTGGTDLLSLDGMASAVNGMVLGDGAEVQAMLDEVISGTATEVMTNATEIKKHAFYEDKTLTNISMPNVKIIKGGAFYGCSNLELTELPSGVTHIESEAFRFCGKLALTSLPSGITLISGTVFQNCKNLALTSLPKGLTTINSHAFGGCTGLTNITFEGTPQYIDSKAFISCDNLTTINVPWAEGEVANAPWGATNATINYNYTGA